MASIMNRIQKIWNADEDEEYVDDEQFDGENIESYSSDDNTVREQKPVNSNTRAKNGRVVTTTQKTQLQVVVYKPDSFGQDTTDIAKALIMKNAVVLNLENTEDKVKVRILDFLSGVAFAQNGKVSKVASCTYIITPFNVNLSGEEIMGEVEEGGMYY